MKKYNAKQMAYSQNKVRGAMLKLFGRFVFMLALIFLAPTLVHAITNPADIATGVKIMGGAFIFFTMGDIGNITQPNGKATAANQVGYKLWLLSVDQIDDTVSFPTANSARQLGNIPRQSGEVWHRFDGVANSLKYTSTGEKGDINSTYNKDLPIIIGYSVAALNFLEEYQGRGFILAWRECESDTIEITGSFCKPAFLKNFEVKNDGDGKYITLTFGNDHWAQPYIYTGDLTVATTVTIAADETVLAYQSGKSSYTLSDGTGAAALATVSGITSDDYGKYLTVYAPATASNAPTIPDSGVYVLKDASTWTANPGSEITFQILDDETLVEVSRVQA